MSAPTCPRCGAFMSKKDGRFGAFWGCLNFPDCRGTRKVSIADDEAQPRIFTNPDEVEPQDKPIELHLDYLVNAMDMIIEEVEASVDNPDLHHDRIKTICNLVKQGSPIKLEHDENKTNI